MRFFTQQRWGFLLAGLAAVGALLLPGCAADEEGLVGGDGTPGVPAGTSSAYATVVINGKTWMAANLNQAMQSGSWCYGNDPDNCSKYGRLYDWNAAKAVCPAGWRLPSRNEWSDLVATAGGPSRSGATLRSDRFGFKALPGGYRHVGGSFALVGNYGCWWTLSEFDAESAYHRGMGSVGDSVGEYYYIKDGAFSVRCVLNDDVGQGPPGNGEGKSDSSAVINPESGQPYDTVIINNKAWMAENFNYATASGSWCYGNDNSNCGKYGRLYNWATAQTVCPNKWRLPSITEWESMINAVGGSSIAGEKLKSATGWDGSRGNGTDDYGFSALPGGGRYVSGRYDNVGSQGSWWTATEGTGDNASYIKMQYNSDGVAVDFDSKEERGFSVRCIRDVRYVTVLSDGVDAATSNYYYIGEIVIIWAGTPPEGQRFVRWTSPSVSVGDAENTITTFTMPDKDVIVKAEFELIPKEEVVDAR